MSSLRVFCLQDLTFMNNYHYAKIYEKNYSFLFAKRVGGGGGLIEPSIFLHISVCLIRQDLKLVIMIEI